MAKLVALYEKSAGNQKRIAKAIKKIEGPLFQVKWFRVVLDEAHEIKSRDSASKLNIRYIILR